MEAKAIPQFHQCHLDVLHSLYDGNLSKEVPDAADEILSEGGSSLKDIQSKPTGDKLDQMTNANTEEAIITDKTWSLIQQFINRRSNYLPQKYRQIHWAQIQTESQSRLDNLLSISSELQETKNQKRKQTPSRTPLLKMMNRPTTPLSLTPVSSNKKDISYVHEGQITSWTFINSVVQKRARLCTSSCEEFRAQSFLRELYDICDARVNILKEKMEQIKLRRSQDDSDNSPITNFQKMNESKRYFFRDYHSLDAHTSDARLSGCESSKDEELIRSIQIKLCLWSNLLASVREIFDEKL